MTWPWLLGGSMLAVCGAALVAWAGWSLYRKVRRLATQGAALSSDLDSVLARRQVGPAGEQPSGRHTT